MPEKLKYLVDDNGRRTSVVVPIKKWEELNRGHQKLQNKLAVLLSIKEGFREIERAKKTGKKLQTLSDFLK